MSSQAPDHELHLVVLYELLGALGAHGGLELVIAKEAFDAAAEDAALGVQLVHGELPASLHVGGQGPEWSGEGQREADPDGILGLRA